MHSKVVAFAIDNLNSAGSIAATLELRWIKAHVAHIGNERADDLAKQGAGKRRVEQFLPMPQCFVKDKLARKMTTEWKMRWSGYEHARLTKQFFPNLNKKMSRQILNLSRLRTSLVVTMITGHNDLGYYTNLCNPDHDAACSFCNTSNETFFHLIAECPAFLETRLQITGSYVTTQGLDISHVLAFLKVPAIERMVTAEWCLDDSGDLARISGGSESD